MADDNKVIKQLACIERPGYGDRKTEQLRLEVCEYNGKPYVSLRVWWQPSEGEWAPGKKGCSIRMGELAEIASALTQLAAGKPTTKAAPRRNADGDVEPHAERDTTTDALPF